MKIDPKVDLRHYLLDWISAGQRSWAASADREGNILRRVRRDTSISLDADLATIDSMIREVAAGEEILGMGAAIGGPLDWEHGIVSPLHQPA